MPSFSISDVANLISPKPPSQQPEIGFDKHKGGLLDQKPAYTVIDSNWYTAKPYGFKFTNRGNASFTMFLPISPSNLTIQTEFATNLIPTLYGTTEEHSPVRYYNITVEGTTGMVPRYVDVGDIQAKPGRIAFTVSQGLSSYAGGFFTKTLSLAEKAFNTAKDLISGVPTPETGVFIDQTGYMAFHNLYRFLLKYKEDVAGDKNSTQRTTHPLIFFNYKDNNQYNVIIKNFILRRSAENPMLYYYSITMRGYNLDTANEGKDVEDQTEARFSALGLDGVDSSSILSNVKGTADKVKGILGPLGAGINVLGR